MNALKKTDKIDYAFITNNTAYLNKILDLANVGIAVHDTSGTIKTIYVNKAVYKISGYTVQEFIKMGERAVFETLHPEDFHVVEDMIQFLSSGDQENFSGFHRFKRKDGNWIWLYVTLSILERQAGGKPAKVIAISLDLSDTIQTHPQVERLLKENYRLKNQLKINRLTRRQLDIARLIGKGKTNQEIADILNISALTVKTHRGNIQRRLNCKNTASLIKFCIDSGF